MKTISMTGVTGFLGASLAARLLCAGWRVIALSRRDPDGARTRGAIEEALNGFDIMLPDSHWAHLVVIDAAQRPLHTCLEDPLVAESDVFWHGAAEMAFLNSNLPIAFRSNVCFTSEMYQTIRRVAPNCQRFYYVSTAYTCGMGGRTVLEELHTTYPCINAYQTSKWCAEHALNHLHQSHGLPVTIFRPTMIVGHSKTAWTRKNGLGIYRFVDAIVMIKRLGGSAIRMNLSATGRPDMVPIDQVIEEAYGLLSDRRAESGFEIFHAAAGCPFTTQQLTTMGGQILGVNVTYGPPETDLDREAHNLTKWLLPFGSETWQFDRSQLEKTLARNVAPITPSAEDLLKLVRWYCASE